MSVKPYSFFPLAFRMRYINRWGLMRNSENENLSEHASQCAMLAHALAVIGNEVYGRQYDAGDVAVKALYHDISEIFTGDLPTPVKYANTDISGSYKEIERKAAQNICARLPEALRGVYAEALDHESDAEVRRLVKAADKLCALIKCMREVQFGNTEFSQALASTKKAVDEMAKGCEELAYFMEHLLPSFEKTLDEQ